jgi:hypothetical protein
LTMSVADADFEYDIARKNGRCVLLFAGIWLVQRLTVSCPDAPRIYITVCW